MLKNILRLFTPLAVLGLSIATPYAGRASAAETIQLTATPSDVYYNQWVNVRAQVSPRSAGSARSLQFAIHGVPVGPPVTLNSRGVGYKTLRLTDFSDITATDLSSGQVGSASVPISPDPTAVDPIAPGSSATVGSGVCLPVHSLIPGVQIRGTVTATLTDASAKVVGDLGGIVDSSGRTACSVVRIPAGSYQVGPVVYSGSHGIAPSTAGSSQPFTVAPERLLITGPACLHLRFSQAARAALSSTYG